MEHLVDVLANVLREPAGGALEPETILIQSKGMERWLSNQLAERLGVFANARFPFPRAFIDDVFDVVVPLSEGSRGRYSREVLTFSTLSLMTTLLADPAFLPLRSYLEQDENGLRAFQLAERIAHVFDQYLVYRPRMILKWEQGSGSEWQPKLWRALRAELGGEHFAGRAQHFFKEWSPLLLSTAALPKRVCLVGISSLPPIYLKLLNLVSQRISVHVFALCPSPEYFAQLKSSREVVRARRGKPSLDLTDRELSALAGNPLLASLGKTGRQFQHCLEEDTLYRESGEDLFQAPPTTTLLGRLQHDIVTLEDRTLKSAEKHQIEADDGSVSILSCHSPLREVEVLRDQLLGILQADETLTPGDILVMSPNIDVYAPLVDAVFGVESNDALFMPYRIADRTERASNPCAKALLAVLETIGGRMTASELLDLLQLTPIRRRFGIEPSHFNQLQNYIHEAGIRWGIDAEHRAHFDQPAHAKNTWRFGLDRLLLGVALPQGFGELFLGQLPFDDVEGESASLLGQLAELLETMVWAVHSSRGPRPVSDWVRFLCDVAERMIAVDELGIWQQRAMLDAIFELGSHAETAHFENPIELSPLVTLLTERFDSERASHHFLAGGVTFCAMLPMRSIPFKVVVLLGMNDGAFPRVERKVSFDLMDAAPMLGDRCLKDEDRYLFLETILSTRQKLIVSYVGRSVQDNAELPPSPVVSELREYIEGAFRCGGAPLELVVQHPLQPFSPRYFQTSNANELFSFSEPEALGAQALSRRRTHPAPFFDEPLPAPERAPQLELGQLIRFLQNPARGFLQNRLGIFLGDDPKLVEDREPIELGPLERHELGLGLLERAVRGQPVAELKLEVEASGALPHGTPGSLFFDEVWTEVEQIAARAARWLVGDVADPISLSIPIREVELVGHLRNVYPGAQVFWQYARVKPKNELALWIRHLALHASSESKRESVLSGRCLEETKPETAICVFEPLPKAEALRLLGELVELYGLGQERPLPLFPHAAKVYVEELAKARGAPDPSKALQRAREAFAPSHPALVSESRDPYVARVFAGREPLAGRDRESTPAGPDLSFETVSHRVFLPMLRFKKREGLV